MGNKKSNKKVVGIAVVFVSILAIVMTTSGHGVLVPQGSNGVYYLDPDNSSAPAFCQNATVDVWINSNIPLFGGTFEITTNPDCGNIVIGSFDDNTTVFNQPHAILKDTGSVLKVRYQTVGFAEKQPGVYHLGTFSIHCNSTDYCVTDVNFTPDLPATYITNTSGNFDTVEDNGTFTCEVTPTPTPTPTPPIPAVSGYYLNPDNSSAPAFCQNATVDAWINSNIPLFGGTFEITTNPDCGNIVIGSFDDNTTVFNQGHTILTDTGSMLKVRYQTVGFAEKQPGVYHLGTFSIHCNSTDYCVTDVNFTPDLPATYITNTSGNFDTVEDNGTFMCEYYAQPNGIYYFDPDNSSAPAFCQNATVDVWINSAISLFGGTFEITINPDCGNIVIGSFDDNTTVFNQGHTILTDTGSMLKVRYQTVGFAEKQPGVYHLGDFSIHCNSTDYCVTDINFTPDLPATYITNTSGNFDTVEDNGTFTCVAGIHDVNVSTDYTGAVNGIKITRDGTDVVGADENLTIGQTYKIRYKLVNEGDFDESVDITVKVENTTWEDTINTHTWTVNIGQSKTGADEWNTTGLAPGTYNIRVNASIANDAHPEDNERTREAGLEMPPDMEPPASITNLAYTNGTTWINWTWTNPLDADFNYTMVYLNGTWEINTSDPFHNATGLAPDTLYEIGTRTVDEVGNINATWVNGTAKTLPLPDVEPPASITNLAYTNGTTWINWTWTNPSDEDFNYTMVYLNGIWETNTSDPFHNATGLAPDTLYEIGTRTVDEVGNINATWANGTAKTLPLPDVEPPASITDLAYTNGTTWINWTWTNPLDADFNYTMVYLNGTWQANTSGPFYNATGLAPDTLYEIGARTVDEVGNINATWVNGTAKTLPVVGPPVSITDFWIENTPATWGQSFEARLNLTTTTAATEGWYVIVVSGNELGGDYIAGIGTVYLTPGSAVNNLPVLVHIPIGTEIGDYALSPSVHTLSEYPGGLITYKGPRTATVQ